MDTYKKIYKLIFLLALLFHIGLSLSVGFNNSIIHFSGFREAQTAITSYYFDKEGINLINYQTPLFGPPWQVPMEFPIFQTIVSLLFKVLPLSFGKAGMLTSLLAFYGFIFFVFKILKRLYEDDRIAYSSVTLILVSPVYLFWSRTFMIETTALLFASVYTYLIIMEGKLSLNSKIINGFMIIIFGCLAALSKITTFILVLPIIILLIGFYQRPPSTKTLSKTLLLQLALYIGIPLLISFIWLKHTDVVKLENPLTVFLTSKNLQAWNFGTLKQKLSPFFYKTAFFSRASLFFKTPLDIRSLLTGKLGIFQTLLSIVNFILIGLYGFIFFRSFAPFNFRRIVLLASYLSGIVVFTNLYYEHQYYWTACTFFLSILIAVTFLQTIKNNLLRIVAFLFAIIISVGLYFDLYFQIQYTQNNPPLICSEIKKNVEATNWVLIYNCDWSSVIPFYSERRSIMVRDSSCLSEFDTLSNRIDVRRIRAVVIEGDKFEDLARCNFIRNYKWKKIFTDNNYSLYMKDSVSLSRHNSSF